MNPGPISANSVSQTSSLEHYLFEPRSAPYLASLLLLSGHLSPADSISRLSYHLWLSARFTQQKAQATYQKAGRMASFFPPGLTSILCLSPFMVSPQSRMSHPPGLQFLLGSLYLWPLESSFFCLPSVHLQVQQLPPVLPALQMPHLTSGASLTVPSASSHQLITRNSHFWEAQLQP